VQRALGGAYWIHPADREMSDVFNAQGAAFGFPPVDLPEVVGDLADGQRLAIGNEELRVIHTPGHSPGHVTFLAGGDIWSGDVLFAGSVGRTDLPGGSWEQLESSIRERLFPLGDEIHVHPGHGPATTIGRERRTNPFVGAGARGS
jgi:glyoxylase-like metal-dependent hydrolase (beta-lactamase superfamily II)